MIFFCICVCARTQEDPVKIHVKFEDVLCGSHRGEMTFPTKFNGENKSILLDCSLKNENCRKTLEYFIFHNENVQLLIEIIIS